jgi:hypothetical protein
MKASCSDFLWQKQANHSLNMMNAEMNLVVPLEQMSNPFMEDLKLLARLSA